MRWDRGIFQGSNRQFCLVASEFRFLSRWGEKNRVAILRNPDPAGHHWARDLAASTVHHWLPCFLPDNDPQ